MSSNKLNDLIKPLVEDLGYEFVGIEHSSNPKNSVLRIYIDEAETGIDIKDCEKVSREVAALMDVEDPISGNYTLEVSSPGLDRPIFSLEQFNRFIGQAVSMTLFAPVNNRRKFKGQLLEVLEHGVCIDQDGERVEIDFDNIAKSRLRPDYAEIFGNSNS